MEAGKQEKVEAAGKKTEAARDREGGREAAIRTVQASVQRVKGGQCKALILCDTKLCDEDVASIAPAVKATTTLRSLSFFGANLSLNAAKMLADALASHESLTMLDLGQNRLGSEGVEAVCNALIHNSSLKTLGLASTDMGDSGATAMAHVMRINCSLTEVYLNRNNIREEGACELAGALLFNDSARLSRLFLHGNHLGENGVAEFRKLLEDSPQVEERVPLDSERALALAMGIHPRLGANSPVYFLFGEPSVREGIKGEKKGRRVRTSSLLKVVRECCSIKLVKRGIYGLEP